MKFLKNALKFKAKTFRKSLRAFIFVGLIIDTLYGQGGREIALGFPATIFVGIIFISSFWIKERLAFRE